MLVQLFIRKNNHTKTGREFVCMKKLFCLLALIVFSVSAGTTYIATGLGTLMGGLGDIGPGDTLLIMPGTYNTQNFYTTRAGTADQRIVVRGSEPNAVFINPSTSQIIWFDVTHPYWTFENLVVNGRGAVNHAFKLNAQSSAGGNHSSYTHVRNCKFIDFSETPIKAGAYSKNSSGDLIYFNEYWPGDYLIWENNENTGDKYGENGNGNGFNIDGAKHVVFRGNYYYDMRRNPTLWGSGQNYATYSAFIKGGSYNCIFENNVFKNAGWGLCVGGGCMAATGFRFDNMVYEVKNTVYRNNVVRDCEEAVRRCGQHDSIWIYNNTFIRSKGIAGQFLINNIVMGTGASVTASVRAATNYVNTTYSMSYFWNPSENNYSLRPEAATVIGVGTDLRGDHLSSVNYDMLGTLRPATPRIGAFEIYDAEPAMSGIGIIPVSIEERSDFQDEALYKEAALNIVPNPANPTATISFMLKESKKDVELTVMDLTGRTIKNLFHGPREAGRYSYTWNGDLHVGGKASSGAYLVKLRTGMSQIVSRLYLVK